MNPRIPWKVVVDPLWSAEHTLGTAGLEDPCQKDADLERYYLCPTLNKCCTMSEQNLLQRNIMTWSQCW